MKRVTRANCHVDRTACAWLIKKAIDRDPTFIFVDDPDNVPDDATPFDIRGAELSHRDGGCSFETILRKYEIEDPIPWEIAHIIHEADIGDDRYDAPEARGLTSLSAECRWSRRRPSASAHVTDVRRTLRVPQESHCLRKRSVTMALVRRRVNTRTSTLKTPAQRKRLLKVPSEEGLCGCRGGI